MAGFFLTRLQGIGPVLPLGGQFDGFSGNFF